MNSVKAPSVSSYPDLQKTLREYGKPLEGQQLELRKEKAPLLWRPNEERTNAYEGDQELRILLEKASIDSDNYVEVMDAWNGGATNLIGKGVLNEQLKNGLDALADKRRMIRDGVKSSDIPEGATNRDMLKKVYFNEINDFGNDSSMFDGGNTDMNQNSGGTTEAVINAQFDKFKDNTDVPQYYRDAIEYMDLDGPANVDILEYAVGAVGRGGGVPAYYPSTTDESQGTGLMSGQRYVEGVGYVQ